MSTLGNVTQITNDVTALAVIAGIGIGGYFLFQEIKKLQPTPATPAGGGDAIVSGKDCQAGFMTQEKTKRIEGQCGWATKAIGGCFEGENVKNGLYCEPWAANLNLCKSAIRPTYECAPIPVDQVNNPQLTEIRPVITVGLNEKCNRTSNCSVDGFIGGMASTGENIVCDSGYCSRVTEQMQIVRQTQIDTELNTDPSLLIPAEESPTGRIIKLPVSVDPSLEGYRYGGHRF